MKKCTYSTRLNCENKDIFNIGKERGYDGIILDFEINNLDKLPSRNFYMMQTLKTGLSVPAIISNHFKTTLALMTEAGMETALTDILTIIKKMEIRHLFIGLDGEQQIKEGNDINRIRKLLYLASNIGQTLDIKIGFGIGLSDAQIQQLSIDSNESLFAVIDHFDDWTIS